MHLNFEKNSFIEIYNDFSNKKYLPSKKTENLFFYKSNNDKITYITSNKNISYVDYEYKFPLKIKDINISLPYLIYNNINKSNFLEIIFLSKNKEIKVKKIRSDGSLKFGNWEGFPSFDILEFEGYSKNNYLDFISKTIKVNDFNEFKLRYKIGTSKNNYQKWSSRFLSNINEIPENIKHSVLINAELDNKIKSLINSCKKIDFSISINQKNPNKHNYLSYGIKSH